MSVTLGWISYLVYHHAHGRLWSSWRSVWNNFMPLVQKSAGRFITICEFYNDLVIFLTYWPKLFHISFDLWMLINEWLINLIYIFLCTEVIENIHKGILVKRVIWRGILFRWTTKKRYMFIWKKLLRVFVNQRIFLIWGKTL